MKKFLILFSLLTIISLNGKLLGIIRDATILNLEGGDAVVISFIKIWFVLPCSFLLVRVYHKLLSYLSKPQIFLLLTLGFCGFFATFLYYLEPNISELKALSLAGFLAQYLPSSASIFLTAIRDWPYTLFFVAAEMWTVFMFSFLFWSFASEVVSPNETKKFYGYFSLDLSGILAGLLSLSVGTFFESSWHRYLQACLWAVFFFSCLQVILYMTASSLYDPGEKIRCQRKARAKAVSERLKNSKFFYKKLFGIVFLFEFCDHFLDIIWKNQLRMLYPDNHTMGIFLSQFIFCTGVLGVFVTIFISSRALRQLPWLTNASVTPLFILLSSTVLFSCFIEKEFEIFHLKNILNIDHCILYIGTVQACFLKILKCTFFDNSKEMAFLSVESKSRAHCRSICDTFSSRFAKSSSALSWQVYAMIPGAMSTMLPIGFVVLGGAVFSSKLVQGLNFLMQASNPKAKPQYDRPVVSHADPVMEPT